MATQYVCDRCKKITELGNLQKLYVGKQYQMCYGDQISVIQWDVCSDCLDLIKGFIKPTPA